MVEQSQGMVDNKSAIKIITKPFDIMRTPEWQAAKNKIHNLYKFAPGFSGIGGSANPDGLAILVLFYEVIPDNMVAEMDEYKVEAKITGRPDPE